ncbi:aminopeptidase P1 [Elaeis guineensis]|uniref:Xaa-Pro aminopeptidase n=1 Tax=Elaeis guineensis var. tenera TaxID=51953 RepID=A0A6I9SHH6_ELAGV|nr:aminopeptidase P1 isoform X2 [Elaeis guineensis]
MEDPLDALRSLMASHSPPLHALVVPSEDNHQSEYVSARDKRRAFVSGFTGSAGLALITMNEALLWTDGRYFLQATQQLTDRWKLMRIGEDPSVEIWIADNLPSDAIVGIDPWCVSVETAQRWEQAFLKKKQKLFQLSSNLVDEVWKDRPSADILPVTIHPLKFSGRTVAEKLKDLRKKLKVEKANAIIVTALDEVAWLYNVRGNDVAYNPVVHAYAVVTSESAFFYVDKRKISSEVFCFMDENGIEIREYSTVDSDVSLLASGRLKYSSDTRDSQSDVQKAGKVDSHVTGNVDNTVEEKKHNMIWIDPSSCSLALYSKLMPDRVFMQQSPLALAKAIKNPTELDGLRMAHIRDGAAVVQFLVWLDNQMQEIYGASGYFYESEGTHKRKHLDSMKLTEVSVSDKLEGFRAKQENFKGLSFPTISSVGPNAAVIHYSPESNTCAELDANSIYLFDSGAQYLDGTTDITRTVHLGKPSSHEKSCFTAVLQGHIALDTAKFPNGTTGHALDILARIPLWKDGLDYRHGTGHGIGSYLNVHEGPHLISFKPHARNVPLQASMTVTDEPGYYEDGNFGIRLENVLIVKEASTKFNFGEKGYLAFEHITWAPYQKKLMDLTLLMPEEIEWVNSYHAECRKVLAPYLNEQEMEWLKKATEPIHGSA